MGNLRDVPDDPLVEAARINAGRAERREAHIDGREASNLILQSSMQWFSRCGWTIYQIGKWERGNNNSFHTIQWYTSLNTLFRRRGENLVIYDSLICQHVDISARRRHILFNILIVRHGSQARAQGRQGKTWCSG